MIVRCANCHTEFSLDDHQIGPEGATVRCSVCSYVFPVDAPPGAGDQPWQIRTVEDLLFTAPDLATLQTWIAEGRLHPDDKVSRTGRHWLRLGDMPEFSSVFSGFGDLPQVFVEVEGPPSPTGSALDELGPPPSFGGSMPVVHGVDTSVLELGPDDPSLLPDDDVPVGSIEPAVERSGPIVLGHVASSETSAPAPAPFPLAEVGVDDESAVRMRPRPHLATTRVSAIPDVVEDDVVAEVRRRRPPRPTVRYGAEEVHSSSMLDAVTKRVDEEEAELEAETTDVGGVRATAAAVERHAPRDSEPSVPVQPRAVAGSRSDSDADVPAVAPRRSSSESSAVRARRRHHTFARGIESKPPRRIWPVVAVLGIVAGVALVFGVPSIRARVMGLAGTLAGDSFDPTSLPELEQARAAMVGLDPVAVGAAEAALQSRIDGGKVPAAGVAEMKLAQAELLATRAIEHAVGRAAGAPGGTVASDEDAERANGILGSVVVDDVVDREHMRRVRARVRLARGRPAAEILPLVPDDGSGELRQLVEASPLWREPEGPVPEGTVAGLRALPQRGALAEVTLSLAYLRSGNAAKAADHAQLVLDVVPGQPTAFALRAAANEAGQGTEPAATGSSGDLILDDEDDSGTGGDPPPGADASTTAGSGSAGSTGREPVGDPAAGTADDARGATPSPTEPPVKAESTDSLIERGCELVESGSATEGLELLRRAKARRPGDLDMLLCTGMAHAAKGRTRQALQTYELALRRSTNFAAALRQAAKAADKLGETEKALNFYRRLLGQRPGDAAAKAYVEAHG